MSNVPSITWSNGSPVLPQELDILAGVQADIDSAFGGGVNASLQSPQGQLAQSETAIIGDKNDQIAYIANQMNPSMASGIWQDAIGYIYFMERIQATGTIVNVTCNGAVGAPIPSGTIAQDTNGYLYASTSSAVIGANGFVVVQFQNQSTGPIPCAIGALNKIYTAVAGLDSITNTEGGFLGNDVESREEFELRRKNSVAINSRNSLQSIHASVLSVPNVIDAFVVENNENATVDYGATNYPLVPHCVCVSVAGGNSNDIAKAIWNKKPPGCLYTGNISETVYDDSYPVPQPSYQVTFLIPDSIPIYFKIEIENSPLLPSNIEDLIKNAVIESFYGQDGGSKVGIASTTYSGKYYANINAINPYINTIEVYVGLTPNPTTLLAAFGINQLPIISAEQILVTLV